MIITRYATDGTDTIREQVRWNMATAGDPHAVELDGYEGLWVADSPSSPIVEPIATYSSETTFVNTRNGWVEIPASAIIYDNAWNIYGRPIREGWKLTDKPKDDKPKVEKPKTKVVR